MKNLGRPDFYVAGKMQVLQTYKDQKIKSNSSEQGEARRDDSREE